MSLLIKTFFCIKMKLPGQYKHTIVELLLLIVVCELITCGSGQIIHITGILTLRMFLFLMMLIISMWIALIKRTIDNQSLDILIAYLLIFSLSISISAISGITNEKIFADIKPLSFFFCFLFLYYTIKNKVIINDIITILKYASLAMAMIYLLYIIMVKVTGHINWSIFYQNMEEESDFMFRGKEGELFYKGFIFLSIGFIAWFSEKKILPCLIILAAIYFTLTRGFYIITFLGSTYYVILSSQKNGWTKIIIGIFAIVIGMICIKELITNVGDDREAGDNIRIETMNQVFDSVTPISTIVGHGFGNGVPIRKVHMENSYLEIFHKQGLIGLLFWIWLLYIIHKEYKRTGNTRISKIYYIGTILIYVQSIFNPYIINPIGIGWILLSYFSLRILKKDNINNKSLIIAL